MVRTGVLGKLRMRKQNSKTTVPLDAVPERRTERCSPRFLPGDRFLSEPSFRYLSPGIEGEKCRPLDHLWQIPFIHSVQLIRASIFCINRLVFELFPLCGKFKEFAVLCILGNGACTLANIPFERSESLFELCCVPYGTRCCVLAENRSHLRMRISWTNEKEFSWHSRAPVIGKLIYIVLVILLLLQSRILDFIYNLDHYIWLVKLNCFPVVPIRSSRSIVVLRFLKEIFGISEHTFRSQIITG